MYCSLWVRGELLPQATKCNYFRILCSNDRMREGQVDWWSWCSISSNAGVVVDVLVKWELCLKAEV